MLIESAQIERIAEGDEDETVVVTKRFLRGVAAQIAAAQAAQRAGAMIDRMIGSER